VLALLAAWIAPPWLNPSFRPRGDAVLSLAQGAPFALSFTWAAAEQPPVTLVGVDGIKGAAVAGVWVVTGAEYAVWGDSWAAVADRPAPPRDAVAFVDALAAAGAPVAAGRVPAVVGPGDAIVVLWEITDCGAAPPGGISYDPDLSGIDLRLRNPLGATVRQVDSPLMNPLDHLDDWVDQPGNCPG